MKHLFRKFRWCLAGIACLVLVGATVASAGDRIKTTTRSTLYDANGQKIGKVGAINTWDEALVFFDVGAHGFVLAFGLNRMWFYGGNLVYESADCTGQPFVRDPTSNYSGSPIPYASALHSMAYRPIYGEPSRTISVGSWISTSIWPENPVSQCRSASYAAAGIPVEPVMDISNFTPPFTVRVGR